MIELLLQAERAAGAGHLDQAERLYWQAIDADSQNAIAIVGLAKVARLRGDDRTAIAFGRRALKVDSENAVARRLVAELEAAHPEEIRPAAAAEHRAAVATEPVAAAESVVVTEPVAAAEPAVAVEPAVAAEPAVAVAAGPLPVDPGVRPPRGGRADLEWPAADLEQVRQPRER